VTAESEARTRSRLASSALELVLCAVEEPLARAWETELQGRPGIRVHHGSVLEVPVQAVVSPANSFGWMRGGIDAIYAEAFPNVEQTVRSGVLAFHGGELPVGEALIVPTGVSAPAWLISAPTMRQPGELLPVDTVHPYLAARGVFRLWQNGLLDEGVLIREVVRSIGLPGLGTGVGGVSPATCARQVIAAWDEVFAGR
jgi:O-acetyl-ADP-ribose deacetylase (regulator of RNase III)